MKKRRGKIKIKDTFSILNKHKVAILIYLLTFIFFVVKVNYYTEYVQGFPDESQHIGYVTYLDVEDKIIPDYYEVYVLKNLGDNTYSVSESATNYLGHPSLYYNIIALFNDVEVDGDNLYIDVDQMRFTSQCIGYVGLMLAFAFGLSRIKKNGLHLLYATIMTSVPMFAYTVAGVNNDTLAFTGMVIFAICAVRLLENRDKYSSYIAFALSIAILMFTKVTAGLVAIITCILVLAYIIFKEKSLKILFNKYFAASIPVYLIIFAYYMKVYIDYGTFQVTLESLNYEFFVNSGFHTSVEDRAYMSFIDYAEYWKNAFMKTWATAKITKTSGFFSIDSIAILSLLFLPILTFFNKQKSKLCSLSIAAYIATFIAIIIQFVRCYQVNFLQNGYMGGYQSRYYICAIIFFAFAICITLYDRYKYHLAKTQNKLKVEVIFNTICIAFSALLIYEDFIYFIINYKNYL